MKDLKQISVFITLVAFLLFSDVQSWAKKTEVSTDGSTQDVEQVQGDSPVPASDNGASPAKSTGQDGEHAARKYFRKTKDSDPEKSPKPVTSDEHYLALNIGGSLSADAYQFSQQSHTTNNGRLNVGLTYRVAELSELADWAVRADFLGYEFAEGKTLQLALLPMIMFPNSGSHFPLYFGLAAGPGIFFSQINNLSYLAFDYELVAGARLFNVADDVGFFMELGLKNSILLLSQGQFNGVWLNVGSIFTF